MITIYTVTYNEEILIQFMIDHYRKRFPNCRIVVFDNMSTDQTVKIARDNGCEVVPYDTSNQYQDRRLIEIKNNCWKKALTDWVLVCDLDELLDINATDLKKEEAKGTTIIRSEGYDMISMDGSLDIPNIKYGARSDGQDKSYLFNKKYISEINYEIGAHKCSPSGSISYSQKAYKVYHYCFINEKLTVKKRKIYARRLSPENLKHGWSFHFLFTPRQVHDEYMASWKEAVKVR